MKWMDKLGSFGIAQARRAPWTNVYGVARSLIALSTASTLVFSHSDSLFRPAVGSPDVPKCYGFTDISLFCQAAPEYLEWMRWCAVILLLIVASGWRPRFTGVVHWWVSFSLVSSAMIVDGGDHIAAILALLLIPVTLTDPRKWHWQSLPENSSERLGSVSARLIAWSALVVVRVQVAGIYFHAAVGKMSVPEWTDGTGMYYWLTSPFFGAAEWLQPVLWPILTQPVLVTLLTWSVIVLELVLFLGLVIDKKWWPYLLWGGIALHVGIALMQGLISFSVTMIGALILYLRPSDYTFASLLSAKGPDAAKPCKARQNAIRPAEVSHQENGVLVDLA